MDLRLHELKVGSAIQGGQVVQKVEIDKGEVPELALIAKDAVGILMK
jgi:hypothetical protein